MCRLLPMLWKRVKLLRNFALLGKTAACEPYDYRRKFEYVNVRKMPVSVGTDLALRYCLRRRPVWVA